MIRAFPALACLLAGLLGCDTLPGEVEFLGMELREGPRVLLDSHLFETVEGVRREVQQPERDPSIPNPLISGTRDQNTTPYLSVLFDEGRYRIWYNTPVDDRGTDQSYLGYMESADGINWQRPHEVLPGPQGGIRFGASVLKDGDRYLLGFHQRGGFNVATSERGFDWDLISESELIEHDHDIAGLTWDPIREVYIAIVSTLRTETNGGPSGVDSRQTMQSISRDLITWEEPWDILTPDFRDPEGTQFYAMDGFIRRGDLLIGMVKILRDDLTAEGGTGGMGWTALAWSRDGRSWHRDRNVFLGPDPRVGSWDHAHAWIDDQLLIGDTVRMYYGGYADGHKADRQSDRQIGLVSMLRDRYVAWSADNAGGRLRSRLLRPGIDGLTLNADAEGGEIRVAVVNQAGEELLGSCQTIVSDGLDLPVVCEKGFDDLREPFRLIFDLTNASLFAINVL